MNEKQKTPFADKYREIVNLWNYDDSYTVTSLPVWDLNKFRCWLSESLEIMNVNHTCMSTYQRREPHIKYMQEGEEEKSHGIQISCKSV
jgi:hypothetical protein